MMLTPRQAHWLNTPLFNVINYWSILHLIYGMIWGFTILDLNTFLVVHFIIQVLELCIWFKGDFQLQDLAFDTVLGVAGIYITKLSPKTSAAFIAAFVGLFFAHA